MKYPRRALKAAMAGMLIAAVAWAASEVYNFKGGVQTRPDKGITKQELTPLTTGSGFFTWTYTFMIYLDDDSSGMIQFTYWKLYLLDQHGLYFAFNDKGDHLYLRKGLVSDDETTYTADPPELKMGPHYWKGFYPDFYVRQDFPADKDQPEMKADLHFHCRTPGWRPGEGPVHYGTPDGDWYDIIVMIPWADLDGTITINGKTRKVKGFGYSDHNYQTVFPTTQCDELMALRSFSKDYSIDFLEYIAPEKFGNARTTWLLVMKDHKIIYATDKWERKMSDFATEPRRGYKYPQRVTVTVDQPGVKLTGEIQGVKFVGAVDAMDEVPEFVRSIAQKFVNAPVFIRQNAVINWHLTMPDKGIDDTFTAKGVYETTIVK